MPHNFGLMDFDPFVFRCLLSRPENIIESFPLSPQFFYFKIISRNDSLDRRDRSIEGAVSTNSSLRRSFKKWGTRGKNFFFPPERTREKQEGRCRVRLIFHIKSVQREFSREKQSREGPRFHGASMKQGKRTTDG